jgi:ketosteroid isomerase-like protein
LTLTRVHLDACGAPPSRGGPHSRRDSLKATESEFRQHLRGSVLRFGGRERRKIDMVMDAKQTVMALYSAYATGDAEEISHWLHDEVVWTAPAGNATQVALGIGRPEDAGLPRGANDLDRDAIVAFMAYNFARFFGGVENSFRTVVADGDVVVVEHTLSATLPNGRSYVNDYCFVYELRGGKVWRIREYMDTRGGWAQVFGADEPVQLVEFVLGR